ncbi:MAG: hypothetical protein ACKVOW_01760 [Chitinophagaceae bacterium]
MLAKKLIFFFVFVVWIKYGIAQAKDIPDYRTKKESFAKFTNKVIRADLGVFTVGGIEESIGKLPLNKLSPFSYTRNLMSFKGDGIEVTVTTGRFEPAGRKLTKVEDNLVKIDNKPFYGAFGEMPVTAIKSITVLYNKDTIVIPPAAYADLFNLNFTYKDKAGTERTSNGVYFSKDGKRIYIYLLSRDDAGSYEVTWILEDKKYLRRVMDWGFTK